MQTRRLASNPAQVPEGTLVDLFLEAVERFGDQPALRVRKGARWEELSYRETLAQVRRVASALRALGLERGARAAILAENRPEWALADYGCLTAGVVDIPIYPSLTAPQIAYILRNSGAQLVFVSDVDRLQEIEEIASECPALKWVVVFDPPQDLNVRRPDGGTRLLSWTELLARGSGASGSGASGSRAIGNGASGNGDGAADSEQSFRREALSAQPQDTATIIYTSGTTGDPKGVMLSHDNLCSNVRAAALAFPIGDTDSTLSFLPLSHVLQRMVDFLLFNRGCVISYACSFETVSEDLRDVRPTVVVSVPRVYEKVYSRVIDATGPKEAIVRWARGVGGRWADAKLSGGEPSAVVSLQYRIADRLVFAKIRKALGGRLRFFVSGGAPLSPEINRFFFSAGILILEGYGLTETSPVTNVNSPLDFPTNFRIGTVGKPVAGTEIGIAEDGEILVRGRQVMKGYLDNLEATRDAITEDGWFHTGDIGELDPEGFLRITDRKKDIIATAGGKKVAPQPLENRLKANRYVEQAVLIGDRRRFLSLLLVPNVRALTEWARGSGVPWRSARELLSHERVQRFLESEVARELSDVSRVEFPKKIVLVDDPFTIENGSLTPSQKVRRKAVETRYREVIDAVYADANRGRSVFTAWEPE
ncbi:MAG: long-chain fatty acid--CoA ligase [Gemmatimonadetes bacterium]|nr:long-chain fatty acid--CoA ligase [Gemmatimonadota bacterium]